MKRRHIHIQRIAFAFLLGAILAINPLVRAVEFAGGTGEPNDPYLIATADQFLRADFNQPDVYYQLCSDIDFKEIPSVYPLSRYFRAHLDGAGYRIQHVTMDWPGGLLGTIVPEATVTDLIVEDAALSLIDWDPETAVGIIAAGNNGTISNCRVTGWLAVPHAMAVGGLVGSNGGSIANCAFDGCVAANWTDSEFGLPEVQADVGGLVGWNVGSIVNCYATGTALGQSYVGGLVGANGASGKKTGSITDCYATTDVMAEFVAGGLVASNGAVLKHCYAAGWVTGETNGGLIGLAGQYDNIVIGCIWDVSRTHCTTSSGGLGLSSGEMTGPWLYAANGWAGDPNWVFDDDWTRPGYYYPRLFWEGSTGKPAPEPRVPYGLAGSGTPEDPYQIASWEDFDWLATSSVFWDKHFILVKDVGYSQLHTIGISRGSAFAGTFDGNGHVIRGVHMDTAGAMASNLGVFGHVTGQIRNLTVENAYLASGPNSRWVGLLAGTCEGVIENCHVTGSVTVGRGSQCIGGLVGYVAYKGGQVVDCSAEATIEAGEGSTDVGPLIGYQEPGPWPR